MNNPFPSMIEELKKMSAEFDNNKIGELPNNGSSKAGEYPLLELPNVAGDDRAKRGKWCISRSNAAQCSICNSTIESGQLKITLGSTIKGGSCYSCHGDPGMCRKGIIIQKLKKV